MPLRVDERDGVLHEIDRWEGVAGWIAHPEELMQRASHALIEDESVWIVDPVDVSGLDEWIANLPDGDDTGTVEGVVVSFDRHRRDAAAIATRHDVAVHVPAPVDRIASDLPVETVSFRGQLGETGWHGHVLQDRRLWSEVALVHDGLDALYVPESLGGAPYFCIGDDPVGVHPLQRLRPPRDLLRYDPDRLLFGHGPGIESDARRHVERVLSRARRDAPRAYARGLRRILTG